jgi:hypothetical protein
MQDLVSLFLMASAVVAPHPPVSVLESHTIFGAQVAQVILGRTCETPNGHSCPIKPRPVNTVCYCGDERGVVR